MEYLLPIWLIFLCLCWVLSYFCSRWPLPMSLEYHFCWVWICTADSFAVEHYLFLTEDHSLCTFGAFSAFVEALVLVGFFLRGIFESFSLAEELWLVDGFFLLTYILQQAACADLSSSKRWFASSSAPGARLSSWSHMFHNIYNLNNSAWF